MLGCTVFKELINESKRTQMRKQERKTGGKLFKGKVSVGVQEFERERQVYLLEAVWIHQ